MFKAFTEAMEKYQLRVHHMVLMSNHHHPSTQLGTLSKRSASKGILATATEENLHRAMQYFNSRFAVRFNRSVGRTGHPLDAFHLLGTLSLSNGYRNPLWARMVEDLSQFPDSFFSFWAFGKKMDVQLVGDHLALLWGKRHPEYVRILVQEERNGGSDEEVKKGLKKMLFGSADFIQRMQEAYCRSF